MAATTYTKNLTKAYTGKVKVLHMWRAKRLLEWLESTTGDKSFHPVNDFDILRKCLFIALKTYGGEGSLLEEPTPLEVEIINSQLLRSNKPKQFNSKAYSAEFKLPSPTDETIKMLDPTIPVQLNSPPSAPTSREEEITTFVEGWNKMLLLGMKPLPAQVEKAKLLGVYPGGDFPIERDNLPINTCTPTETTPPPSLGACPDCSSPLTEVSGHIGCSVCPYVKA